MNTISIEPIDVSVVKLEEPIALAVIKDARQLVISDQPSYNLAGEILGKIKSRLKWLEEQRKSLKQPALELGKRIDDFFRAPMVVYGEAEGIVKIGMLKYATEEERKRSELEAKLRREAEKKRLELEAKAEKAREEGNEAKAEKYDEKVNNVIEPILAPTVEQPRGVSFKELWRAEVIDFAKLPDSYKLPDMTKLNKVAQATKNTLQIAGVKFYMERIVSSRAN